MGEQLPTSGSLDPRLFVVPFDGSQPDIDPEVQKVTAQKFAALVDNTLLTYPEGVYSNDESNSGDEWGSLQTTGPPNYELNLIIKTDEDSLWRVDIEKLEVGIEDLDDQYQPEEVITHFVRLQRESGGRYVETYDYRLDLDGVVRRFDTPDTHEAMYGSVNTLGFNMATATVQQQLGILYGSFRIQEAVDEVTPNTRFEREIGLNDQPVSLREIQALENFITQPGVQAIVF